MLSTAATRSTSSSPQSGITQRLHDFEIECSGSQTIQRPVDVELRMSFEVPFSWLETIKLNWLPPANEQVQHLLITSQPSETQISAAFYPKQHDFKNVMLFQIASLVNNMVQASHKSPEELSQWLNTIPRITLKLMLKALPSTLLDALSERLFVLAVMAGRADIVSDLLDMNVDPNEPIMTKPLGLLPMFPLEHAVREEQFSLAKKLVLHMLRGATPSLADKLLSQVFTYSGTAIVADNYRVDSKGLKGVELQDLVTLILDAGARPVERCVTVFGPDFSFIHWMKSSKVGLIPWLELAMTPVSQEG